MQIIGVDFSGARTDRHTWVTLGRLEANRLALEECRPMLRRELVRLLADLPGPAVAALDFPFSVPQGFATFWNPAAITMPDLWATAASMELPAFIALRDAFVARHGEEKRRCDRLYPECYSCLHKANPNLVPMTFYGMQMLHQLWAAGCHVPPLEPQEARRPLLLEAMPGAALRAWGLPYKGYKNGRRSPELRRLILDGLPRQASVSVCLDAFYPLALDSHDALDSLVAAAVAATWATNQGAFLLPFDVDAADCLLLEGWLYAPRTTG